MAAKLESKKTSALNLKKRLRAAGGGIVIGIAVAAVVLAMGTTSFAKRSELITLDYRYRARPAIAFRPDLGYIDYDDSSSALFGSWPWPRYRQVALVKTLDLYDAKAAGYDVFFLEHNDIVLFPDRIARGLDTGTSSASANRNSASARDMNASIANAFRNYDDEFEQALTAAGTIFLAQIMDKPDADLAAGGLKAIQQYIDSDKAMMPPEKIDALDIALGYAFNADSAAEKSLYKTMRINTVIPGLAQAAAGIGYAQIVEDLDQTVRLYPLFMYYDHKVVPSIAVVMLANLLQVPIPSLKIVPGDYVEFPNAVIPGSAVQNAHENIRIPVDDHGQMLMNWAGGFLDRGLHVSFLHISAFYALNRAKEISRGYPATKENYSRIRDEIRFMIDEERLIRSGDRLQHYNSEVAKLQSVPASTSGLLARQVALARVATPMLEAGQSAEQVFTTLFDAPDGIDIIPNGDLETMKNSLRAVEIAIQMKKGTYPGPSERSTVADSKLGAEWTEEIKKNITFFRAKNRIDDVEPLFFPPAVKVPWDGTLSSFSPTDLEGKIFMIGLTGVGTIDLNPMPFERACPMVALHTNAINTVLTRQFLHFPTETSRVLAILGLALAAGLICSFLPPLRAFLACAALSLAYSYAVYLAWANNGRWLYWVEPLAAVGLTYLIEAVIELIKAIRERQKVRGIFSTMVSPNVLKLMEQNPDRFSLTGERKNATTFFSAIEGFGKVTQNVAPEELSSILGLYLTPTSEIIMDYDGYIDKYEGHVIMADFGVPLDDPDHSWKCCYAAIEQQQDIEAFRVFVSARYGADVQVSMGINSGFISAGNMGSEKKMQYTVMGDAVNVAARFRPANLIYNTGIITGEAAEPLIRNHTELRVLDRILLKGKTKPTAIYEVMGWKTDAYLQSKNGKPLPPSLLVRWSKAPPEKIFGYIRFWRAREAEYGNAMAGEFAAFFESLEPLAETIMVHGAVVNMHKLHADFENLVRMGDAIHTRRDDQAVIHKSPAHPELVEGERGSTCSPRADTPPPAASWQTRLQDWKLRVATVLEQINSAAPVDSESLPEGMPTLADLKMQAVSLAGKIDRFEESLPKSSKLGIAAVNSALQTIRDWFAGVDIADAEIIASEKRREYQKAVHDFFATLSTRAAEYHQMMSRIGSLSERQIEMRRLFEEALHLHWDRKWDDALELLRRARDLSPEDGPALTFIDRIEGYKKEPPGPAWQGEFVQKKK